MVFLGDCMRGRETVRAWLRVQRRFAPRGCWGGGCVARTADERPERHVPVAAPRRADVAVRVAPQQKVGADEGEADLR